jgi:hypothetical protein
MEKDIKITLIFINSFFIGFVIGIMILYFSKKINSRPRVIDYNKIKLKRKLDLEHDRCRTDKPRPRARERWEWKSTFTTEPSRLSEDEKDK